VLGRVAILVVVVTSCGSELPPRVTITGIAADATGHPWPHAPMAFDHRRGVLCQEIRDTTYFEADDAGMYQLALSDEEIDQAWKEWHSWPNGCLSVRLLTPDGGPSVNADLTVEVPDAGEPRALAGPTLQAWSGNGRLTSTSSGDFVTFDDSALPTPASLGTLDPGAAVWIEEFYGAVIWRTLAIPTPVMGWPPEVLEDFYFPVVKVTAWRWGGADKVLWDLSYVTDPVELVPGKTKAPSRGAACSYEGAPAVCPLTDGKLDPVPFSETVRELVFSWPTPHAYGHVAIHGSNSDEVITLTGIVEAAVDGGWTPIATGPLLAPYWVALQPVATTQVRLRSNDEYGYAAAVIASEVSFFDE
jgi:hypothetical protein